MTIDLTHQQIEELLGAYALDGVDADEAEVIELHLRDCPRCRAEVSEHREVAALLAHTGTSAPDGVWGQILDELEAVPPALRMPDVPSPFPSQPELERTPVSPIDEPARATVSGTDLPESESNVVGLRSRRSTIRVRTFIAVVTLAAAIVSILGVVTVNQSRRLDTLDASLREVSVDRIAARAMSDPQAATGKLTSGDGKINAPVVLNAKGMGYLLAAKMPELPEDRTYQLWGDVRGSTVSLGVFDGGTDVVQFQVGKGQLDDLRGLAVTEETAPGVAVSKHRAVVSGSV